jgi:hypothetical protein
MLSTENKIDILFIFLVPPILFIYLGSILFVMAWLWDLWHRTP